MTPTNPAFRDRVLHRDDDLRDIVQQLLQRAERRRLWVLFLDERGCLADPLIPLSDLPDDPEASVMTGDLGDVTHAYALAHRIGLLLECTENASAVLAWERLGPSRIGDVDRAWSRAVAAAGQEHGVPIRAQFLVHDLGVRQVHPDDYV